MEMATRVKIKARTKAPAKATTEDVTMFPRSSKG
jgi:hypothetical protein